MPKPKLLLHLEGAAVLLAACILYHLTTKSWWWFAGLFLVPDLFMLGYLANKKLGTLIYNFAHTYTVPIMLAAIFWLRGHVDIFWIAWIWLAHQGWDRLVGYGLKYETAFKDTHLQRV